MVPIDGCGGWIVPTDSCSGCMVPTDSWGVAEDAWFPLMVGMLQWMHGSH